MFVLNWLIEFSNNLPKSYSISFKLRAIVANSIGKLFEMLGKNQGPAPAGFQKSSGAGVFFRARPEPEPELFLKPNFGLS